MTAFAQLQGILRLLKKIKHRTQYIHLRIFDVNNHYPQGMDAQGNDNVRYMDFHRGECYFEEHYLR